MKSRGDLFRREVILTLPNHHANEPLSEKAFSLSKTLYSVAPALSSAQIRDPPCQSGAQSRDASPGSCIIISTRQGDIVERHRPLRNAVGEVQVRLGFSTWHFRWLPAETAIRHRPFRYKRLPAQITERPDSAISTASVQSASHLLSLFGRCTCLVFSPSSKLAVAVSLRYGRGYSRQPIPLSSSTSKQQVKMEPISQPPSILVQSSANSMEITRNPFDTPPASRGNPFDDDFRYQTVGAHRTSVGATQISWC